jgi:hypothetical protein
MHGTSKKLSTQIARVPHTEVPDRNIGVPPVRKYATFRTLSKGRFPLGGIFHAERTLSFLISFPNGFKA